MQKWNKHTYVCGNCDSLLEVTTTHMDLNMTCVCAEPEICLLSVEDATINTNNQQKEETPMETTDRHYMTREFLESQIVSFKETIDKKDELIRNLENRVDNLNKSVNAYYSKEQQLRSYLMENYESLEMHTEEIAEIFDIPLTKEIEFEATLTVNGTVEVPLFDEFDLEDFIQDNIYVDSAHGEVSISGHSVDHVVDNS